jgi:hypothetical protein
VITTAYSAPQDYVTADNGYLIEVAELVPAKDNRHYTAHEDLGLWALPRGDHLEALLRQAAADERERRRKGEQARRDVLRRWTWQHAADAATERLAQVFDIPRTERVQAERDQAASRRPDPPEVEAPRNNHGAYSVRARYRRVVAGEPEGKRLVAVEDERAEPFAFGSGPGDLCADVIFADVVDAAGYRFWARKWLGAAAHRTGPTLQIERALARLGREDLVLARHEHPEHGLLYAFEEELFNSREVVHYCDRQLYFNEKECRHIEAFCDLPLEVEGLPFAPLRTLTDLQIARVGGRILFLDFEPRAAFVQEPGEAAAARRGQGI